MAKQTLDEFADEMGEDLLRFVKYYKAQRRKNPENWPLKNEPVDWFEQFSMWAED